MLLCCTAVLLCFVILQQQAEVQIPEPPADRIAQLTDMGFSEALARNALLLHRGSIEASMEWLLEHGDDPAAAEPIPQERLQQVCVGCKETASASSSQAPAGFFLEHTTSRVLQVKPNCNRP